MKKTIILFVVLCLFTMVNAQKMRVMEGKLKNLKGITEYALKFDYSDLKIPKYDSEEDFLKDKMAKREEKEEGAGERFKKSWFADREDKYEPKFIVSFNKRFEDGAIKVSKNLNFVKYLMKVHTTKIYPGYNVGVWRHNAEINVTITVMEVDNPTNVLFSASFKDVQGNGAMGYDFDSGYRISECYAKTAKTLAKHIKKLK